MSEVRPKVVSEIVCAEPPPVPCGVILFGASGDLTRRKILGSIFELFRKKLLHDSFWLLGVGRTEMTEGEFRGIAMAAARKEPGGTDGKAIESFIQRLHYQSGDYSSPKLYETLARRRSDLDARYSSDGSCVYYLAVPPTTYATVIEGLGSSELAACPIGQECRIRLVIEKPYGRDLASAHELDETLGRYFQESQVYRIDHYQGKETVQNILVFRSANSIFEPVWNRDYIDHVQITVAEAIGIGHRSGYYDSSGAMRDMMQNHILQMVSLVGMEPSTSFEAEAIRDERTKLLCAIRPFNHGSIKTNIIRGQYGPGAAGGELLKGYEEEDGVPSGSKTETFVAVRLMIDNKRWKDVPFYVRTGKRLARRLTEIAITFKPVVHSIFTSFGLDELPGNVLVFKIQPEEGISLSFQAKRPGSKVCMGTLGLDFNYGQVFGGEPPEAYQRLLLDCMAGDQTLFTRRDASEAAWRLLAPVLEEWEKGSIELHKYAAGSQSFEAADRLIEADGRKWRNL